ncbi:MAG: ABC transporter permease [Bacteroidota bacterium]
MRRVKYLLKKEFKQIFRNKAMLPLIFVLPIIQLLILVNAATFEIKKIDIAVLDQDQSQTSRSMINKLLSMDYYQLNRHVETLKDGQRLMDQNEIDMFIHIPTSFETDLQRDNRASLMLDISAVDGAAASIIYFYTNSIIFDFNRNIIQKWHDLPVKLNTPVVVESRFWYNEELEYKNFITPGLMVILVTMIGMFLSSMNVVREKELGTIEQINVTPITKGQFIISKLLPFWIIGMFELAFGLAVGKLIFDFPVVGSIPLLFGFASIFLVVVLSLGLIISTITNTQQQAMLISWFFAVIFILMSGLFTPVENMPYWAQDITLGNPITYFMQLIRMVLLKGSEFEHVTWHFSIISIMAVVSLIAAMFTYRKRS